MLYDAYDFSNLINARRENLLPSEGAGSTPQTDNAGAVNIAGEKDVRHFEYHYTDNKGKDWGGNIYLFDSRGQYGCYAVYTLASKKAEDYDRLQEYAGAMADSFRIDEAFDPKPELQIYRFDEYGIKLSLAGGTEAKILEEDCTEGTIRVRFESDDKEGYAFIIPGDPFGTEFSEIFTGVSGSLPETRMEIASDMAPMDFGEYRGYRVKVNIFTEDGSEGGVMYGFSTGLGSDAKYQSYVVFGSEADDRVLKEIAGGFRFDGATAYDNQGVDVSDTVSIVQGTSGDGRDVEDFIEDYALSTSEYIFPGTDRREITENDIRVFLESYLETNDAKRLSDKARRVLCARALCYARNEIYARHGYIFNSRELRDLFVSMRWYYPTVPSERFDSNIFTPAEKHNIEFLKAKMEEYGGYQPAK